MATAPPALWRQYQALLSQRAAWEADWRDLATYILPRKSSAIGRTPNPGEKQTTRLFDSTAAHANGQLGASMQGSLTSGAVRWARLRMRDAALNRRQAVALWLEDTANRAWAAFQQSNWAAEVFEVYLDLGAFGTGAMLAVPRDDLAVSGFPGLRFEALPIGTYTVAEDAMGRVDTLYRCYQMAASAAVAQWGAEAVGEKLRKLAATKPSERVEILHAVYPRRGGVAGGLATRKPWASCYLAVADKHVIRESGFEEFPYLVPRWTKAAGEVYGRGPGHIALPDIRTLNKMTELELRAVAKAIDPPLLAKDHGVIGAIRLTPGAVTTTRDDPARTLIPLEGGAKFQVGQIKAEQLKSAIRDMFFNSQLQFPTNQPMTATEIERRYEIMHRILGPTLGRLEYELTMPAMERVVMLLHRHGALAPAPPELVEAVEAGAGDIDIIAEGPLAQAQKGSDVLATDRYLALLVPLAEHDPSILDNVDFDQVARVAADATNVPPSILRAEPAVAERRAQRAAATQQAEQTAQLEALGKGARNVAPLLKAVAPQGLAARPGQPDAAPKAA